MTLNCKYVKCYALAAFGLLLGTSRLFCERPTSTPGEAIEPVITEETLPEEAGVCDLRSSFDYRASGLEPANALPRFQLFCGIASRWGAELDVPFAYPDQKLSRAGFGDVATTLKYRVNGLTARIPIIVLGAETRFPTGRPRRGTGEEGYELQPVVAVLAQRSNVGLQGNLGIGFPVHSRGQMLRTYYEFAVTLPVASKRFYFAGEANASHVAGGDSTLSLSPGLHCAISPHVYAAIAAPVNVVGGAGRVGFVLQIQFPVLGTKRAE